jgi:hypothetical protein
MTHNDWILDVLADLKAFASANGLVLQLRIKANFSMYDGGGDLVFPSPS